MSKLNKNLNSKFKNIIMVFKNNITFIIFILVIIYAVLFFFTIDNLNKPETETLSIIIFLFPSIAIFLWLIKIVVDRFRKKPGSGLTMRLTLYFLLITLIPLIMLVFNSNNLIEKIYQDYISLDELEVLSEQVTSLLTKKTEETLIIDIANSTNRFYHEYEKSKRIPQEIETDIKQTDYVIIFNVDHKKNQAKIVTYLVSEFYKMDAKEEINNQILNDLLKDNFFFEPDIMKIFIEDVNNNASSYKLPSNKYINFYINHMSKSEIIIEVDETTNLDDNKDLFAMGVSYIPQRDLDISNKLSELSGRLARQNIQRNDAQAQLNRYILYISLPIALISILLSFYLAIRFTRPMESLIKGTKSVAAGDLKYRINTNRQDELGLLIDAFNKMADELEQNKFSLYRAQKAAAWREVARKLAHEIKNPLTPIQLAAERIKRQYNKQNPNIKNIIETCTITIIEEVDRLSYIIHEFSEFAREPESKKSPENIKKIVSSLISSYSEIRFNIKFKFIDMIKDKDSIILLDKKQIKQVLINLLENSVDVVPAENGKIEITLRRKDYGNLPFCVIEVYDNGSGISEEAQKNIFTPYFTTKKRGTGLGLVIVKNIIEDHDGLIYFKSNPMEGTTFFIELPIVHNENTDKDGEE